MSDQEVMSELVSAAQERIRYRDLIRELVGALDEAMGWNWLSEDMPEEQALRIEHTLSRARKELGE